MVWALPPPRPEPLCQVRRRRRSTCRRTLHACVARGDAEGHSRKHTGTHPGYQGGPVPPSRPGADLLLTCPPRPHGTGEQDPGWELPTPPTASMSLALGRARRLEGSVQLDPKSQAQERGAGSGLEARKHTTRHLAHHLLPTPHAGVLRGCRALGRRGWGGLCAARAAAPAVTLEVCEHTVSTCPVPKSSCVRMRSHVPRSPRGAGVRNQSRPCVHTQSSSRCCGDDSERRARSAGSRARGALSSSCRWAGPPCPREPPSPRRPDPSLSLPEGAPARRRSQTAPSRVPPPPGPSRHRFVDGTVTTEAGSRRSPRHLRDPGGQIRNDLRRYNNKMQIITSHSVYGQEPFSASLNAYFIRHAGETERVLKM